jgi:curved DNA-binding protein CbpA
MAPNADPYRTLGLERGASLEDVKRAYRRLAKANHPDAAGESALPRFLAIQAAYDQIAGPDARTRRPGAGRAPGATTPRRPWEADPDRAGATHRAYGGRGRTRPGPRARQAGPPPGPRPGRPPRSERPPNKATLGSTSYDGAEAEPLDPDWGGASWYGTSSGTYWTLNPKEYADPRKHGPEYQARARRVGERRTVTSAAPSESLAAEAEPEVAATQPPSHTATSWWQANTAEGAESAGTRPDPATAGGPSAPRPAPASASASPSPSRSTPDVPGAEVSTDAVLDSIRAWLDDRRPPVGARIGRAVIAWAPIALGIGWLIGEASGCARFSADCQPAVAPASWTAQLAVLALLIAVTRLARITAFGTIVTLAAVIPASVLLLATFDPESMNAGRVALGGLMVIAWVAGIAYGIVREIRRPPIERPVS